MNRLRRILVTGHTGFVGRHLVDRLLADDFEVRGAGRSPAAGRYPSVVVDDLGPTTDWRVALAGCDTVIHLAGQSRVTASDEDCRVANDLGTAQLCRHAIESGVSNILFVSSVKALVDNRADAPVSDATSSIATTAYGRSKHAAEAHVAAFAEAGRIGISLRPPIVYGPGAKGGWRTLERIASSGIPLPFKSIRNRRSLISVTNLVDAIVTAAAVEDRSASGRYAVCDPDAVSLAEIITLLRERAKIAPRLFPMSTHVLRATLSALGRSALADTLLADLEIDDVRFRRVFAWSPRHTTRSALLTDDA